MTLLTQDERYRQQVRPNVGISMCLGSMGRTRMLELLTGARFSVERRRGWLNRDVEERLIREGATPARKCVFRHLLLHRPEGLVLMCHSHRPLQQCGLHRQLQAVVAHLAVQLLPLQISLIAQQLLLPSKRRQGPMPRVQRLHRRPGRQQPRARSRLPRFHRRLHISAAEWDSYFAGRGEVRGFAVGDAPAPPTAAATPREPSPAASAAGGRARTRSPRRHDYGGGRSFQYTPRMTEFAI